MAHPRLAAIRQVNQVHVIVWISRVAGVAAGCVEVLESAAGHDVPVGQPALKLSDDDWKVPSFVAGLGVLFRKRKRAHLSKGLLDDFAPGHFRLVAVMAVLHRRRKNVRLPQDLLEIASLVIAASFPTLTAD